MSAACTGWFSPETVLTWATAAHTAIERASKSEAIGREY